MRRLPAVAVSLLVLIAACGGEEQDVADDRARTLDPPASAEAPAKPEGDGDKLLSESELQAALLTVQDLPTGYTVDTSLNEDDEDEPGDECAARFEALDEGEVEPAAEADIGYEGGFGIVLEQGLSNFEDEDDITAQFDSFSKLAADCPKFTSTDADGAETQFTVGALSFPKLGDDTLAFALTVETPDVRGRINIAIVQLGRNVMYVSQGGLTADAAVLEQAARKGLERLAAAS